MTKFGEWDGYWSQGPTRTFATVDGKSIWNLSIKCYFECDDFDVSLDIVLA
jgi:hypothetical protein